MISRSRSAGPRILFIPDTQVKPGVKTDHIAWAASYAADKKPDAIVFAGDFDDFPSLSSYDRGKLSSHGRFFEDDVNAGNLARDLFFRRLGRLSSRGYAPPVTVTLGNHEDRVNRAADEDPRSGKTFTLSRLNWKTHHVRVVPFLKPIAIHGITFVHFCALNANGQVSNGKNGCDAKAQARRMMRSTVSGHRQGIDLAYAYSPGRTVVSVVAGSFYQHDEQYLTQQGTTYWRGIVMLNDIRPTGEFDPMPVSLDYLKRRYG